MKSGQWLLLSYLCSASAYAQGTKAGTSIYDLTLKELMALKVITAASGYEQNLQRAASNAIVINREEWQSMGAYTLTQALASVPGVHVSKPDINFMHNIFKLRGMGGSFGEQIKLLIDGRPLEYTKDGGVFIGFNMPIGMFKRIEIIKGPGSAIYGADAFAGIINLVSYNGEDAPATVTARSGEFGSNAISLLNSFNWNEHHLNFTMDYITSNDDPNRIITSDLQTTLDQIFGTNASHAPGPIDEHYEVMSLMAQWRWQQWSINYYTWRNFNFGVGPGIGQALDPDGFSSMLFERATIDWDLSSTFDTKQLNASFSYRREKTYSFLHVFPPQSILPIGSDGNVDFTNPAGLTLFEDGFIGTPSLAGKNYDIKLTHQVDYKTHQLRWELGGEIIEFSPTETKNFGPSILDGSQLSVDGTLTDVSDTPWVFVLPNSRKFYYLSVQDEWQVSPEVLVTIGGRYDHYSDFGSTTNPRVSLQYQIAPTLTLKAFAGSAFRAPTVGELYHKNNPVGLGNPNLSPENVNTLETGLNADYFFNDNLFISLSLFDFKAKDLIRYVFDPQTNSSVAQNTGEQKGRGGELSVRWKPQKNITANFHYSHQKSQDATGYSIANIPRNMFYFDVNWRINDHWQWSIDSKWIKDRTRPITDTRQAIANYHLINSRLAYNGLIPGLTIALIVRNLFDENASEPSNGQIPDDYPLSGQQWLAEVRYDF